MIGEDLGTPGTRTRRGLQPFPIQPFFHAGIAIQLQDHIIGYGRRLGAGLFFQVLVAAQLCRLSGVIGTPAVIHNSCPSPLCSHGRLEHDCL
jgi:hypothetical protein